MRILFRVDASSKIGLGHIMRCLALSQSLAARQHQCHFLLNQSAADFCSSRTDWVGQVHILPQPLDINAEFDHMRRLIRRYRIDIIVLDGYHFNRQYRQQLAKLGCFVVCYDDTNSLPDLHCQMVINGASNAGSLGYLSSTTGPILCLGEKYRVLRSEFTGQTQVPFAQRDSLTIVMGGSDVANLTTPIVRQLDELKFSGKVRILTGAAYPHHQALANEIQRCSLQIDHLANCQQVANVFSQSRLVISAAGGSQFELQACGAPSILLIVADNQVNATKQAAQQGWCEVIDMRSAGLDTIGTSFTRLWNDPQKLSEMSSHAYQTGDTQGAKRIVNQLAAAFDQWREG